MRRADDVSIEGLDLASIRSILEESPVRVAILYGSFARGEANERSDVDLAVDFEESLSSVQRTQARLALIDQLSRKLRKDAVDVVPLSRMPEEFRREVLADGILLIGSIEEGQDVESEPRETRQDRLGEFDELLADLEKVV